LTAAGLKRGLKIGRGGGPGGGGGGAGGLTGSGSSGSIATGGSSGSGSTGGGSAAGGGGGGGGTTGGRVASGLIASPVTGSGGYSTPVPPPVAEISSGSTTACRPEGGAGAYGDGVTAGAGGGATGAARTPRYCSAARTYSCCGPSVAGPYRSSLL